MHGEIILDGPPGAGYAYVFGQKVSGKVVLRTEKKSEKLESLSIMFQGFEQKIVSDPMNRRKDLEATAVLFHQEQSLLRSSGFTIEPNSTFEAEFEFTSPVRSVTTFHAQGVFFTDPNTFLDGEGFPLPPTLHPPFAAGVSHAQNGSCLVRYNLTAQMNGSQMFFGKKKISMTVPFTAISPEPEPAPFQAKAGLMPISWTGPTGEKPDSTRSKLSRAFKKSAPPPIVLSFRPIIHLPSQLSRTQSGSLSFSVEVLGIPPNSTEDNTLILTGLELQLVSITRFSVVAMGGTNRREIGKLKHRFEPTPLPLDGAAMPIDGSLRLPVHADKLTPTPDFSTPLVHHRHVVRVRAFITHARSGHVFRPAPLELPFQVAAPYLGQLQEHAKPATQAGEFAVSELPAMDKPQELATTRNLAVELPVFEKHPVSELPAFEKRAISELPGSTVELPRFA